jgi:plasmid stabilization system protein ParE
MKTTLEVKYRLKLARWQWRRAQVAAQWGSDVLKRMPVVLGNSMPKSGSHLIIQILEGLTEFGPFVNPGMPPLNRNQQNQPLPKEAILGNLARMKPGDIGYCYLKAEEPFLAELTRPGRASIFVYRDPRDMIVSHVFYATEMHPGHAMHKYYTEKLGSMEERINAAILGVEDLANPLTAVADKYAAYLGWLDQPAVLSMRFEDLILDRDASLRKILAHLSRFGYEPAKGEDQAVETLTAAIQPKKSGTFRKGQPGNWREHFTQRNIDIFKANAGDLLVRLGYEKNLDW